MTRLDIRTFYKDKVDWLLGMDFFCRIPKLVIFGEPVIRDPRAWLRSDWRDQDVDF